MQAMMGNDITQALLHNEAPVVQCDPIVRASQSGGGNREDAKLGQRKPSRAEHTSV